LKKKKLRPEPRRESAFPEIAETAATMECTGLMPVAPETMAEWEAYKTLFSTELAEEAFWYDR